MAVKSDQDSGTMLTFQEQLENGSTREHVLANLLKDGRWGYWDIKCLDVVDWDGDGDFDVIYHDSSTKQLVLLEQVGQVGGGMQEKILFNGTGAPEYRPLSLQALDFDGDSDIDVIFQGRFFERISPEHLMERIEKNPLEGLAIEPLGKATYIHFADWDTDGDLDILVGRREADCRGIMGGCAQTLALLTQQADGSFLELPGVGNPFKDFTEYKVGYWDRAPQVVQHRNITTLILRVSDDGATAFWELRGKKELIALRGGGNQFQQLGLSYGSEPHLVDWNLYFPQGEQNF